ncbi:MAG: Holliday junction resolvase RuvX [Chromatocurvus sp.]
MAFDFGLRQIGVAVGNCILFTTQPLLVLRAREGQPQWDSVGSLLSEWRPDLLLVGEPLNMDGSSSDMAERAGRFARRLHGRFGLPVVMADERLTSFAVKQEQRELGHRGDYHRQPVDSLAAELILQGWMAQQRL